MSRGTLRAATIATIVVTGVVVGGRLTGDGVSGALVAAASLSLAAGRIGRLSDRSRWACAALALAAIGSGAHDGTPEPSRPPERLSGLLVSVERLPDATELQIRTARFGRVVVRAPLTGVGHLDRLERRVKRGAGVELAGVRAAGRRGELRVPALGLVRGSDVAGIRLELADRLTALRVAARERVRARLRSLPGEETRPLLVALLTGRRDGLGIETRRDLVDAGMMHLAVVSGMHVGWVSSWITLGLAPGAGRASRRRAAGTLLAAASCAILFEPAAPVARAALVLSCSAAARLCGRSCGAVAGLAWASTLVALLNGELVASWSFSLSVTATAAILIACDPSGELWRRGDRADERAAVRTLLAPALAAAPLAVVMSGRTAPWGALGSLVALPAVIAALGGGAVASILNESALASVASGLAAAAARFVMATAREVASWSGAGGLAAPVGLVWCAVTVAAAFGFGCARATVRRTGWLALYAALWTWPARPGAIEPAASWLEVVDVGQGQAILAGGRRETVLIDAGDDRGRVGTSRLLERMRSAPRRRLDLLAVTHGDRDHAGGGSLVVRSLRPRLVALPESALDSRALAPLVQAAARRGIEVRGVSRGDELSIGGLTLRALHPPEGERGTGNEESLALLVELESLRAFVPGDAGEPSEREWLRLGALPIVDLLVVGHHGSRSATLSETLRALRPRYAVASAARGHRFGHPHEETRARCAELGVRLVTTAGEGDLIYSRAESGLTFARRAPTGAR